MRNGLILMFVVVFGLAFTGLASAEKSAGEKVAGELIGGLKETLVGSVQIPVEMYETAKENPAEAVTLAPIRGAKKTALQTTEGVLQTGTFILPPYEEEREAIEGGERFDERLGLGLKETALGSIQVPKEMVESGKEHLLKAITIGPVKGAKKTALQTTEGAIRAGTFFIPEESGATSHTE